MHCHPNGGKLGHDLGGDRVGQTNICSISSVWRTAFAHWQARLLRLVPLSLLSRFPCLTSLKEPYGNRTAAPTNRTPSVRPRSR